MQENTETTSKHMALKPQQENKNDNDRSSLLSVQEMASQLRVRPDTIRRWSDQGMLKAYRLGRRGNRRFQRPNVMDDLLTVQEVAELLAVHVNTIRRWSDQGVLTTYRLGHRGDRRFRREDIELFLADMNNKQ